MGWLHACTQELALAGNKERVAAELPDSKQLGLHDLELGALLGQGANAVVYSGRWRRAKGAPMTPDICTGGPAGLNEGTELRDKPIRRDDSVAPPKPHVQEPSEARQEEEQEGGGPASGKPLFDLAVKVLFNYYAASNATAIWDSLQKECLPVLVNQLLPPGRWCCRLPPHPHLVEMWVAFADAVSLLPGATMLWPSALSPRLHPRGCGRNATLYLVMRRYQCTLPEYLQYFPRVAEDPQVRLSLLCQLLEALCHLAQHGVAHRDLKADNCLLDLTRGAQWPRLVLCDFGSCLAEGSMRLHFTSSEVSRGGNPALMAPEVATAKPGLLSVLDYSRADLWAAATLAYELYGAPNPFHDGDRDSRTYCEAELPAPPCSMPPVVRALVRDMLHRDPTQRPSPAVAATVCQMLLLAPPALLSGPGDPADDARQILRWLCSLMARCWPHWGSHRASSNQTAEDSTTAKLHMAAVASTPFHFPSRGKTLGKRPQEVPEAIFLAAKMSTEVRSASRQPCPMWLDLACVLLSRVSLPHALEALRYIRAHSGTG